MPLGVSMARSAKTKRRLLQKRWERRVQRQVEAVTNRLLGIVEEPTFARVPVSANGLDEALNDSVVYSMSYNLYASQPRMSAVVHGISGV